MSARFSRRVSRLFCPSWGRAQMFAERTGRLGLDLTLLVAGEAEAARYRAANPATPIEVFTGKRYAPAGKTQIMQWAFDSVPEGDWAAFIDDDVRRITAPPEPFYSAPRFPDIPADQARALFATDAVARLPDIMDEAVERAERQGAALAGFAPLENYYFRRRKWGEVALLIGDLFLLRRAPGVAFPQTNMDDMWLSLERLEADGSVVINRYLRAEATHFEPGGHGPHEGRRRVLRENEVRLLLHRYAGLVKRKKGEYPDIALRSYSRKALDAWRAARA